MDLQALIRLYDSLPPADQCRWRAMFGGGGSTATAATASAGCGAVADPAPARTRTRLGTGPAVLPKTGVSSMQIATYSLGALALLGFGSTALLLAQRRQARRPRRG